MILLSARGISSSCDITCCILKASVTFTFCLSRSSGSIRPSYLAEGYHLIALQLMEESAIVGYLVIRVFLFICHILMQQFLKPGLCFLQSYTVSLIRKEQVEIVNAKAIYLYTFVHIEMLQNVQHAIDAIGWVESWIIHRK